MRDERYQERDGPPTDGGPAAQFGTLPLKVAIPLVPSRIEELGDLPRERVNSGNVWSLVTVVVKA